MVLGAILLLPAIYVLRIGPVCVVTSETDMLDDPTFDTIYAPVLWVYDNNDTVASVLNWYADMCYRLAGYD